MQVLAPDISPPPIDHWRETVRRNWKTYRTVAILGWQDALVYRFNALMWVLYAVLPSLAFMLVWLARYDATPGAKIGGYSLGQMLTYYLVVTGLSIAITPHPEWEIAQTIRDGKITPFIVRPIGYYGYRFAQETSYQIVKTTMFLPAFALMAWSFRAYLEVPNVDFARAMLFILAALLSYGLMMQIKFALGLMAFWLAEVGGILEIWNILMSVFAGRLLPLTLLPLWLTSIGQWLPFFLLYDFPMRILLGRIEPDEMWLNFGKQIGWLLCCRSACVGCGGAACWRMKRMAVEHEMEAKNEQTFIAAHGTDDGGRCGARDNRELWATQKTSVAAKHH